MNQIEQIKIGDIIRWSFNPHNLKFTGFVVDYNKDRCYIKDFATGYVEWMSWKGYGFLWIKAEDALLTKNNAYIACLEAPKRVLSSKIKS